MLRTRRLRTSEGIRKLVRETELSINDFIYPLFIEEGEGIEMEIQSMPGIKRFSLDNISKEIAANIIENISGDKLNESSIKAAVEEISKKNVGKYL